MFKKIFFDKKIQNSKSGHIYMKDAECAETNKKSIFSFSDMVVSVLKIGLISITFEYKIDHNLKK